MAGELLVWRGERLAGVLRERRRQMAFAYEPDARPISVSMPVRGRAYGDATARTWFTGLLPEGHIRAMIAYDLGVDATDDMGLLAVLGRDCAGALSIREPGVDAADESVGPSLSDGHIAALLRSLPTAPLGIDDGFRVSLPGNQHKLLLARHDDAWHRPDGTPSTHILKPAIADLDATVANEAYCQWLAAGAGLAAAHTEIVMFDGVEVLVSERYDRMTIGGATVRRHQEDGCQALAIDPRDKYQTTSGGPRLNDVAGVLAAHGSDIDDLLRQVVFTVAVGNADWHGKNVSLVYADDDHLELAPIYDAMSTRFYEHTATGQPVERRLGMFVAGIADIDEVLAPDLVAEARSWGMSARRARRIAVDTIESLHAATDTVDAPIEPLRELVRSRLDRLRRSA